MRVRMTWPNTREWELDMDGFAKDLSLNIMRDAAAQIATQFHVIEGKLFSTQGGSGTHGGWPALSAAYKAWKIKHGYPGDIMVLTTSLMNSLKGQTGASIRTVTKMGNVWQIRLGTDVKSKDGFDYPLLHQMGGKGFKKAVKTRRTIDPTRQDIQGFMQIIQQHMVGSARRWDHAIDRVTVNPPPTIG